ncbi:MAG: RNA polymerase sigma factor [Eubacteriales bacterium]|nr:RNA polymerase sigma factor [Eubacteriales bacterium]
MDEKEFAARIWAMRQTLFRICFSQLPSAQDREDAVQEALARAWRKRGQLREEGYLQTWLVRILLNVCHDMQRRGQRMVPTAEIELPVQDTSPDGALREALLALPEKYRLPILLYYLEGYSLRQVAQMLRIPENTVKTRLSRGRQQLKERLHEEVLDP